MMKRILLIAGLVTAISQLPAEGDAGDLDSNFGPMSGYYSLESPGFSDNGHGIAVDSAGRILIAFKKAEQVSPFF